MSAERLEGERLAALAEVRVATEERLARTWRTRPHEMGGSVEGSEREAKFHDDMAADWREIASRLRADSGGGIEGRCIEAIVDDVTAAFGWNAVAYDCGTSRSALRNILVKHLAPPTLG